MTAALGRTIAAERTAKGWTQEELAERIDIHVNSLRRYELGQRDIPHTVTIAVARAVGRRASDLVRDSEDRADRESATADPSQ